MIRSKKGKITTIIILLILCIFSFFICIGLGSVKFSIHDVFKGLFVQDGSIENIIIFKTRLPRIIVGGLVGICLSLSGCILQGVMRNDLASPSSIGVTSGASFVGYLTLVVFKKYSHLLTIGTILGAFLTTMLIYCLAYQRGVSPMKMILAGLAVSTIFGAFISIIRTYWTESIANVQGFLVGGLNGVGWTNFKIIAPYAAVGIIACLFLPNKLNILMLGDETANSLGLNSEAFRFLLIVISSLLAGASIAVAGMIGFVGFMVPHIARLLVGSDYKYLFPASILLGFLLIVVCDTIGRIIKPPSELPVGIIMSFIGAPFFLLLLKFRKEVS